MPTCSSGLTPEGSCSQAWWCTPWCPSHEDKSLTSCRLYAFHRPGDVHLHQETRPNRQAFQSHTLLLTVSAVILHWAPPPQQHTHELPDVLHLTRSKWLPEQPVQHQWSLLEVFFSSGHKFIQLFQKTWCSSSTGRWRFQVLWAVKSVTKGTFPLRQYFIFWCLMVSREFKCRQVCVGH